MKHWKPCEHGRYDQHPFMASSGVAEWCRGAQFIPDPEGTDAPDD